jgi:hypothetical protein
MRRAAMAFVVAISAFGSPRVVAVQNRAEDVLARAGAYVAAFIHRFSNVVAEERYVQDSRPVAISGRGRGAILQGLAHREIVSDYLLVRIPGLTDWRTFRDVREVDGRPVSDRQERLTAIFLEPSGTTLERAAQIDRDGIRYNLGDDARTINGPLLALGFLQPAFQRRFRFSLREVDKEVGPDVWIVQYREQARPTILRNVPDGDLAASGRFWIERATGRVVRTELAVSDSDSITTSFRFDARLQMDVPSEMRESYFHRGQYVTGTATYDGFRKFEVHTEEKLK